MVDQLRCWYYGHDPAHRDRLLWWHFEEAEETHVRLVHAIQRARKALDLQRPLLVQAQAEREALAAHPLPATIEEKPPGFELTPSAATNRLASSASSERPPLPTWTACSSLVTTR